MDTNNAALLTDDVIAESSRLLLGVEPTPMEFHALNSLVEAVVLREYVYVLNDSTKFEVAVPPDWYESLMEEGVLLHHTDNEIEEEIEPRGSTGARSKSGISSSHR